MKFLTLSGGRDIFSPFKTVSILFILFAFFSSVSQSQIITWDFNDDNSVPEINLADGIPTVTANTGVEEDFDNDGDGGLALYYTSWNQPDVYYELSFDGTGYESFQLAVDHRKTGSGPDNFQVQYSSDNGNSFLVLSGTETGIVNSESFTNSQFDFSSITELNGSNNILIRLVPLTQATAGQGRFYMDNVIVSADEIIPTRIVIADINGGQYPVMGQPFNVTVEVQNENGLTAIAQSNIEIQLNRLAGDGSGAITSGATVQINDGEKRITLSVIYNEDETSVIFQPSLLSGDPLTEIAFREITVLDTEPANPPVSINSSIVNANTVDLTIERNVDPGESLIVIGKKDAPLLQLPEDGTHYSANLNFGDGSELESDAYAVYTGSNTSIEVTNLAANSTYYFYAIEYSGDNGTENYLSTYSEVVVSTCLKPTVLSGSIDFENVTSSSFDLTWNNGGGQNRLILMNTSNSFINPVDGTDPLTPNNIWQNNGEQIIYYGDEASIDVYGIAPQTVYFFRIYDVNCSGTDIKYSALYAGKEYTSPYFYEDFTSCIPASWKKIIIAGNSWTCSNETATINGNGADSPTEAWLISPAIDFSSLDNATLSFLSRSSGTDNGNLFPQLKVLYSDLYPGFGNPALTSYNWEELPFIPPVENSNTWKSSGFIDLSDKALPGGYIAFRYVSSGNENNTFTQWSIDNFLIENRECEAPKTQSKTLAISELTNNSAALTWTNGNGNGRIVVLASGPEILQNPANGTDYTANSQYGSGDDLGNSHFVVYNGTGNSVQVTGLAQQTQYTAKVFEYGYCKSDVFENNYNLNSGSENNPVTFQTQDPQLSDIIEDGSFTYPTPGNFSYLDYQSNQIDISNSLKVARFIIRDRNSDGKETLLSEIEFSVSGYENLRQIALYNDDVEVAEVDADDIIAFADLNLLTTDGSTTNLSIRVTFSNQVTDNSRFQFTVNSVTGGDATSYTQFNSENAGGAQTSVDGDDNKISVSADQLEFTTFPEVSYVDVPFNLTISAVDANGSIDLDADGTVNLSSNGGGILTFTESQIINGLAEFYDVTYNKEESVELSTLSDFSIETTLAFDFQKILALFEFTNYHVEKPAIFDATWTSELIDPVTFIRGSDISKLNFKAIDVFSCTGIGKLVTEPQDNYFLEFSVLPTGENTIDLSTIQFQAKRSASGPGSFVLRSNLEDNFGSDIGDQIYVIDESFSEFNISLTGYENISKEVIFRIYLFNSSDGRGSFQLDDLVIFGSPNDETTPEFSEGFPQIDNIHINGFDINVASNEKGKVYFLIQAAGSPTPAAQDIINSPTSTIDITEIEPSFTYEVAGLIPSQASDIYFILEDNAGNSMTSPVLLEDVVTSNDNSEISPPVVNLQIPTGEISSIIDTQAEVAEVMRFSIDDLGNEAVNDDGLATVISELFIEPGDLNAASWSEAISGVAIKDLGSNQNIPIQESTISDTEILLEFAPGVFSVPDNTSKEFSLLIWLNESVTDQQILQFKIPGGAGQTHNCATQYYNSSQFANEFASEVISNILTINVIATELSLTNYPNNYNPPPNGFGITIQAVDENGNIDLDEDGSEVTLEKYSGEGVLTGDNLSKTMGNGLVEWVNELDYTGATDFFSIQADIDGVVLTGSFHSGLINVGGNNLVVSAGETFSVSGVMNINGYILVEDGGELILEQDATINLTGNLTVDGSLVDNGGTLHFDGTTPQTINSSSFLTIFNITNTNASGVTNETEIRLLNTLKLNGNSLFDADGTNNDKDFILISNASNTARIDQIESGAQLTGEVTLQRFINDVPAQGWYFLTTPIKDQDVKDWQDDMRIQGMDNSQPNAYKVMYYYEEPLGTNTNEGTEGWRPVSNSSYITSQKGVDLFVFNSAFKSGALKLDNKGIPFMGDGNNASGSYEVPLSYTSTAFDGGGWNLVANPYPCEINWENVIRSDNALVNNSISIWDSVNKRYSAYVDGVSVNEGSQYIASGRAFFVKANAGNQSLMFSESSKANHQGNTFRQSDNSPNIIRIQVKSSTSQKDETVIRFKEGSSVDFDPQYDALKLKSGLDIFSEHGNEEYSINSVPQRTGVHKIPITMESDKSGIYKMNVGLENYQLNQNLYLIDNFDDTMIPIGNTHQKQFKINLSKSSTFKNRFEILFAEPVYYSLEAGSGYVNDEVLVYVKPEQFKDVSGAEMLLSWNDEEIEFVGIESINLSSMSTDDFDVSNTANGQLHLNWRDLTQTYELETNVPLFAIRFSILGNVDQSLVEIDEGSMRTFSLNNIELPSIKRADGIIDIFRQGLVYGTVKDEAGNVLEGVSINITGDDDASLTSNPSGSYELGILENGNYTIEASTNSGDQTLGINLLDVVKISRHVNNLVSLENPYRVIAADVDGSKQLDNSDIEVLKDIVLKRSQVLPADKAWVIIPDVFDLTADPFAYELDYSFPYKENVAIDFTGIKLGDVDLSGTTPLNFSGDLILNSDQFTASQNDEITISFRSTGNLDLLAYQVRLSYDTDVIEILDIESGGPGGLLEAHPSEAGILILVWEEGTGLPARISVDDVLFNVTIKAKTSISNSTGLMTLSSGNSENLAIDNSENVLRILHSENVTGLADAGMNYQLLQNYPNPVRRYTTIKFYLPQPESIKFSITSIVGARVFEMQQDFDKGWNEISWTPAVQSFIPVKNGVYIYSISAGDFTDVKKMIVE